MTLAKGAVDEAGQRPGIGRQIIALQQGFQDRQGAPLVATHVPAERPVVEGRRDWTGPGRGAKTGLCHLPTANIQVSLSLPPDDYLCERLPSLRADAPGEPTLRRLLLTVSKSYRQY